MIAVFTLVAVKRGFLCSLIEFVGWLISVPLSLFAGKTLATPVYENFFHEKVLASTTEKIAANGNISDFSQVVSSTAGSLPDWIKNILADAGINVDAAASSVTSSLDAQSLANACVDNFLRPAIIALCTVIIAAVAFAILSVLIQLLSKLAESIKLPGLLNGANALLGGVFGLAKGVLLVVVAVGIISVVVAVADNASLEQAYSSSFFVKTIQSISTKI